MDVLWISLGTIAGTILFAFLLFMATAILPFVIGGLTIAAGIYFGIQTGGNWGWILGLSSALAGTVYIIASLVEANESINGE